MSTALPTLPAIFWARVARDADRCAQIVKTPAGWRDLAWREVGEAVAQAAGGLVALGRRPGEAVGLLSRSRAEWVQADFAILTAGLVTVPVYPTSTPEQIAYVLADAGVRTLLVEDDDLAARVEAVRRRMPRLQHVVRLDGAGAGTWAALREQGRAMAADAVAARWRPLRPEDVATIVYTSGTTGEPKGVVQTHANHAAMLEALAGIPMISPGDVHLLFLPLAHAFARLEAFVGVHRGLVTAFAERVDTVAADLVAIRPDFIFGVPRVFEKARARIAAATAERSATAQRLLGAALRLGAAAAAHRERGTSPPPALRAAHALADRALLSRVRAAFGGRLRFAVSGGVPLASETGWFFHALGIPIYEGYGLTEACPALTFNRADGWRIGSVGRALPGVDVRVAADGEILARGPSIARAYLGKPRETAATFDAEGWLHTGDVGRIDADGYVYVTDRKKDIIVTAGGENVAPQLVERALRRDPLIAEAVVYGDRRPYLAALVVLDPAEVRRLAAAQGLAGEAAAEFARHPFVLERVRHGVERANAELPEHARVRRFAVIPDDLTEAGGEVTPTQTVRRAAGAARHAALLDTLYPPAPDGGHRRPVPAAG
jgi:long-chain acyl-CoA synthetase